MKEDMGECMFLLLVMLALLIGLLFFVAFWSVVGHFVMKFKALPIAAFVVIALVLIGALRGDKK